MHQTANRCEKVIYEVMVKERVMGESGEIGGWEDKIVHVTVGCTLVNPRTSRSRHVYSDD